MKVGGLNLIHFSHWPNMYADIDLFYENGT